MDQHENLQELLTRLNNIRDSMEEALGHIRGAIREIKEQLAELVSSRKKR
jgi:flagellar biosynthesis chaperone FliJ